MTTPNGVRDVLSISKQGDTINEGGRHRRNPVGDTECRATKENKMAFRLISANRDGPVVTSTINVVEYRMAGTKLLVANKGMTTISQQPKR